MAQTASSAAAARLASIIPKPSASASRSMRHDTTRFRAAPLRVMSLLLWRQMGVVVGAP